MRILNAMLTLAIGLVAGIGLAIAVPVLAQNPAQVQARLNAQAALGVPTYVKDSVGMNGSRVDILEDHKRNRVCYVTFKYHGDAIDCEVLDRRNPR